MGVGGCGWLWAGHRQGPSGRHGLQDRVRVVGLVGDHRFGRDAVEQGQGLRGVALLPGGQVEGQRVTKAVGEAVQLAGEAAARSWLSACSPSLFFAPRPGGAGVGPHHGAVEHITHLRSASAARRSISAAQHTLLLASARTAGTRYSSCSTSSGTSRHAQPARAIQTTASTKPRVAASCATYILGQARKMAYICSH